MSALGLVTLLRPPNVFTAFADSLAGLLMLGGLGVAATRGAWAVVVASGCLYLAGIVLNDVFDREIDARERPGRPIPSGAVSLRTAVLLGGALSIAGVAVAAWVGWWTGVLALVLAACIVTYDAGAKSTGLGPAVMGCCRGLNMALGLSTGLALTAHWPGLAVAGPVFLALYVAGLTHLARDEVDGNSATRARAGLLFLAALAIGAVTGLVAAPGVPPAPWAWLWVLLAVILGCRTWAPLWWDQGSTATRRAIGGGIMLIPVLDAAVCAVAGRPLAAILVVALVFPALLLKRSFSPT